MTRPVDRPIFIVGVGRCGSTVLHHMFAEHPRAAWLSGFGDRWPATMRMHRAMLHATDWPLVGKLIKDTTEPGECYATWEHHCPGFRMPYRDLRAGDVTARNIRVANEMVSQLLTSRRTRPVLKITGWPRLGYLKTIFPDAKFIHCQRDPRAVVNSRLNVDFWSGWLGPQNWRFGPLSDEHQAEWEHYDQSFVALAAIEWKILVDALEDAKRAIEPGDFLEIRYETLCEDPVAVFKQITEFSDFDWAPEFESALRRYFLRSTNDKYRSDLTDQQQLVLNTVLASYLQRYGYSSDTAPGPREVRL